MSRESWDPPLLWKPIVWLLDRVMTLAAWRDWRRQPWGRDNL